MRNDKLLAKWLNNDITNEELQELMASPEYASYIKISEKTSLFQTPTFNEDDNFSKIKIVTNPVKVKRLNPLKNVIRIAAVFTLIITGYLYVSNLDTIVKTSIAKKTTITLPDNSEVDLNANSEVSYNTNNWETNRTIILKGEAFFRVSKGNTFEVKTSQGSVSVLGTQFNVFSRENTFTISCFEGLVEVAYNNVIVQLSAGKEIKIIDGKLVSSSSVNTLNPSWILNESSFSNTTLANVLEEFKNQYDVSVSTNNIDLSQRFTGTFTHSNMHLALKSICNPLHLTYIVENTDEIILYAKQEE